MKTRLILILIYILLIGNSSCFLFFYKGQTIEKRLLRNAKHISNSDFSKIDFKGMYLNVGSYNQTQKNQLYIYYRFFPDGRVLQKGIYDKIPTKDDFDDLSKGIWSVYYIKENNIYIEQFGVYVG